MTEPHRFLIFAPAASVSPPDAASLNNCQFELVRTVPEALQRLDSGDYHGVCLVDPHFMGAGFLLESGGILENFPHGIVLLDLELKILWCNNRLHEQTARDTSLVGCNFYEAFGSPEILGPDFCPFHTAIGSGEAARSTIRVDDKTYYEVYANPIMEGDGEYDMPSYLLVTIRDVSEEMAQRNKLTAIYQAGLELGDLQPQDVLEMSTDERIELLKSKILHYTEDLLEFDTVEIRLLDQETNRLEPLLSVGMEPVASGRKLYASAEDNGVTGFVAATGNSYLCEDTTTDPLYLLGAANARSSLTVPLILHDETLGTFNVESPRPGAFTHNDLEFLELFGREVAVALNTLDLLVAEKVTTASESTSKILSEVAPSVDQILNDASWIMEKYIGHDAPVSQRLSRILEHTRNIRRQIQEVGQEIAPQMRGAHSPAATNIRSCAASVCSWPTARPRSVSPPTSYWDATVAWSKPRTTAKKRC